LVARQRQVFGLIICSLLFGGCSTYPRIDKFPSGLMLERAETLSQQTKISEQSNFNGVLRNQISEDGLELLKSFEGKVLCENSREHCAYEDVAGYCTIGYGHLLAKTSCRKFDLRGMEFSEGISEERALEILRADVQWAQVALELEFVNGKLGPVGLTQYQYDALVSFIFNVGSENFASSTLLKELKVRLSQSGNPEIAYQLSRWNRAGGRRVAGLVNRRNHEISLFFSGLERPLVLESANTEKNSVDIYKGEIVN